MRVIDVDTHVIEPASVWDLLSAEDQEFKPAILRKEVGAKVHAHFAGPNTREFWVIDNMLYGKHDAEAIASYSNGELTVGAVTLEDVPARLADLDAQGVDTQVVFSSLFLNIRCVRANAELALTGAYNRWIAQRCADSHGRLRWIFVPSLKNPQETVRDMDWAVRNGAVGVLFRGIEGDRFLDFKADYKGQVTFFSNEVYEELCTRLDMWDKPPSVFRRNIITENVDLNSLIGREFEIQNVRFLGVAECSPCHWQDGAFSPGTHEALKDRGGLRAKILCDGVLKAEQSG